jgi:hypothetical protein
MRRRSGTGHDLDPDRWFVVGTPAAGSSASVRQTRTQGVRVISAIDQSFDLDAFLAWAGSVYQRAIAAWRDKNPELLRPVMAGEVWDRYAQFLLTVSTVALGRKLMASATATASLAGTDAEGTSQNVVISFAVAVADAAAQLSIIDERARSWDERWLFQRPVASRTHLSGAVAVCLVCGGPADPAESGQCPYCHSDITTRTAGWLVTQVATTMPGAPKIASRQGPAPSAAPLQPPRAP